MGGIEGEGGVVEVESEGGEKFCDTCVLVDSVSSSSVAWGASVWREWKEEYWLWSSPGGRIFLPPFPGGLLSENPEAGCVCMVWPYPVWRADGSVFSPSWQPALISSFLD